MRGVSILERLAGLCDGVLQSFTQKPQSPPHREMTVAGGTASAHDSPISAPPGLKNRRRTPLQASAPAAHVLPAPRSCSMRAIRFSRMSSRTRQAHHTARRFVRPPARPACTRFSRCCARIGRLRSLVLLPCLASLPCFLALLPCLASLPCFLALLPCLASLPCSRFRHFFRFVPPEPVKCAPSPRGRAARPFARRLPTDLAIVPSNYIVRAIRAITIRR